ncbi:10513_t:CDS:1 [Diversispora eburnea]|uniref:10513_t:CDS:1 n=1 Tax=Diversispora eburnea TaxID=1213867 RepID=A0A9N9FVH1_9GLOM|nr:10513_t:CDS:1 [Diversispora eburnea]
MVPNTLIDNHPPNDEKELKRISSLEQRVAELENTLLRTAQVALEKRVAELENSLKESNEECNKLRKTITEMESVERKVVISQKGEDIFEKSDFTSESGDEKYSEKDMCESSDEQDVSSEISDTLSELTSFDDKEAEIIYGRILKLIENMKSDCTKAINLKIPTMSQLPKLPMRTNTIKSNTTSINTQTNIASVTSPSVPKIPSPTSQSRMPGRSRTPSISGVYISSRPSTPSALTNSNNHQITSNLFSNSSTTRMPAPSRMTSLPSLNSSYISSRPNTPSNVLSNVPSNPLNSNVPSDTPSNTPFTNSVSSHNLRRKSSISTWKSSCNYSSSRPETPPFYNGISSGIPSNLNTLNTSINLGNTPSPSKSTNIPMHFQTMRNCRQVSS